MCDAEKRCDELARMIEELKQENKERSLLCYERFDLINELQAEIARLKEERDEQGRHACSMFDQLKLAQQDNQRLTTELEQLRGERKDEWEIKFNKQGSQSLHAIESGKTLAEVEAAFRRAWPKAVIHSITRVEP